MSSIFTIKNSHNYANNPLGNYTSARKEADLGGTLLYDNVPNQPQIVEFDGARRAMHRYPAGSFGLGSNGGNGADYAIINNTIGEEIYLSYDVYYEPEFDFFVSKKMIGFRQTPSIPAGQGTNPQNRGAVIYTQIDQQGRVSWNIYDHQMTTNFGERRGTPTYFYNIERGKWIKITFRVVMNTVNVSNGIIQIWIDGILRSTVTNIRMRVTGSPVFLSQIAIITFMDTGTAVRRNQNMYMDNIYVWHYDPTYLTNNPSVKRGQQTFILSDTLLTPNGEVAPPSNNPPAGTPNTINIIPQVTTATVNFAYGLGDSTGFQHRINGGTIISNTSTSISLSGLTASTTYSIEIRATNSFGSGSFSPAINFTTLATPPIGGNLPIVVTQGLVSLAISGIAPPNSDPV